MSTVEGSLISLILTVAQGSWASCLAVPQPLVEGTDWEWLGVILNPIHNGFRV